MELVEIVAVIGEKCDAETRIEIDHRAVEGDGFVQRRANALGDLENRCLVAEAMEQDCELVAAEPCDEILWADGVLYACCDDLQHAISHWVPQRVVDVFEPVEV